MTKPSQQCQAQRALPVLHSRSLAIHDPLPFPGDVEFALFTLFGSPGGPGGFPWRERGFAEQGWEKKRGWVLGKGDFGWWS